MQAEIEMVIRCEIVVEKEENADELKDVVGRDVRSTLSRRTHFVRVASVSATQQDQIRQGKGFGALRDRRRLCDGRWDFGLRVFFLSHTRWG